MKNNLLLHRIIWSLAGLILFLLSYEEFRKLLVLINKPETVSDVIPQVVTLYERFANGEFPYRPININNSFDLQPIYMPFTWLPVGLGHLLHLDIRWIGFGFLATVFAVLGWEIGAMKKSVWLKIIFIALPSLPFWSFIIWTDLDLTVTYELVTASYYLLLAIGLFIKRWWLIGFGIIACLLSRYTVLVGLPLFAIIVFMEFGLHKSLILWTMVGASVFFVFILPFYLKEPVFMDRAINHYQSFTVGDWTGFGDPPISWNHELGVSISPIERALFSGSMKDRVQVARWIEILIILGLTIGGWFSYRRWRHHMDSFDFSLIMLYLFMFAVFYFSPLTFRYYYVSFLFVGGIVCAKIFSLSNNVIEKQSAS